jgi:putative oxidoreductase
VLWTYVVRTDAARERRAREGLGIILTSAALLLLPHALAPFVTRDVEGMRQWGEGMGRLGFPFGVPLVWGVVSLQVLSSFALLARRLVVPACLGHLVVLTNGVWISHAPHWFMVGPENNGMEFPVMFIGCFVAGILSYWPTRDHARAREARTIPA